ncbi:MAG: copper transporter [Actinomycetota bacterium]
MIDFRYHLISIVAVLLALSIGIVMGSGVLGGPLLDDIQRRAARIREENGNLLQELTERSDHIEQLEEFITDSEPYLVDGSLVGEDVVLFELPDVTNAVVEELRSSVGLADGALVTHIEFTDKVEMTDDIERDELALALASVSASREDLRIEMASSLGARAATAAESRDPGGPASNAASSRLNSLVSGLEEADFLSVDRTEDVPTVPEDALFIVVGGSEDPGFEMNEMATELAVELVQGGTVLVGETSGSAAELIASIIDDGTAEESIATSDGIDTSIGRVAAVLGLDLAAEGEIGHYGLGPTAEEMIPQQTED